MFEVTGAKGLCDVRPMGGWRWLEDLSTAKVNCGSRTSGTVFCSLQQLTNHEDSTNKFISYFWIFVSCSYAHVSLSGGPSVPHPAAPAALRQVLLGPWPLVAWSKGWAFNDPIAPMLLKSGFRTFRMFHFGHSLTLGGSNHNLKL